MECVACCRHAAYLPFASAAIRIAPLCSGPRAPAKSLWVGIEVLLPHSFRQEQIPDPANEQTEHDANVVQRVHSEGPRFTITHGGVWVGLVRYSLQALGSFLSFEVPACRAPLQCCVVLGAVF